MSVENPANRNGVTPLEFLLHALAGCLTAGIASVAANRGVRLTEVTSTIEGDIDLRGMMGSTQACATATRRCV